MSVITAPETTLCKYMRSVEALKQHPDYDAEDAAIVNSWLANEVPAEHVGRDLRAAGYRTSVTVIKDHRRNVCACSVAS